MLYTTIFLSDTGEQLNVVAKAFLLDSEMKKEKNDHNLEPCFAKMNPFITSARTNFCRRLGVLWTMTVFSLVETLFVIIFIGTDFMENYVRGICNTWRWLKALSSRPNAILLIGASEKWTITTTSSRDEDGHRDSEYICRSKISSLIKLKAANQTSTKPQSTQKVLFVNTGQRLI